MDSHQDGAEEFPLTEAAVQAANSEESTSMSTSGEKSGNPNEHDVEKNLASEKIPNPVSAKDPNLVTWDGPNDPANPKNWTNRKKWVVTIVVSSFTFISPVGSTMIAPALGDISKDFGITNKVESQITLSIFVLAYAFGPLLLAPLSEIYGRVPVLQLSNLAYLAFNIGCGFCKSKQQLIVFRLLAGLGGSAPLAIGGGVLADCWKPEERGRALSIYALAPLIGPVVGPIAGGFIAGNTTWRWVFWSSSIADALIQSVGLVYLYETYAPTLLLRKAKKLKRTTGNKNLYADQGPSEKNLFSVLRTGSVRPLRLLSTQIMVQILGIYMAYLYGTLYLVLATFPALWGDQYHESLGIGGLNYISVGVGFLIGAQVCIFSMDRIYRALKKRNNNVGRPEFRVPLMVPGSVLVPVGLFWYGWSAQAHIHWIMPNIGACIFSCGVIIGFQCIQTFLVDTYTRYAASAIAAATVLRSLAGFGFPLFAPSMYDALGYGWGNSLLAFVAIGVGFPGPLLLWKYGEYLRAKSTFAAGVGH